MAPGVPAETSATALCLKAQFAEGLTPLNMVEEQLRGKGAVLAQGLGSLPLEVD